MRGITYRVAAKDGWWIYGEARLGFSEDGDDVFDVHDKEAIVAFKIDGNGPFGIKVDLVILFQRQLL